MTGGSTGTDKPATSPIFVPEDVDDAPIEIHFDDVIVFVIFWAMAVVVFLQFFSRYVLNDSASWTEEIARYLLMWTTFFGTAIVLRRGTNIAVEVLMNFLPESGRRALSFAIDVLTVGFIALLCWFSVLITDRMTIQRMTVFDVSMNVVYGGIACGCFLMRFSAVQRFVDNARRGWRPDPNAVTLIVD